MTKANKSGAKYEFALSKRAKQQNRLPESTPPSSPTDKTPSRSMPHDAIFFFHEYDEKYHGFLCQWYLCSFTDPESGLGFNCTEQWMMYQKAVLANDNAAAKAIMATDSPKEQKRIGRKDIVGFDPKAWDKVKFQVVEKGNYLKFTQADNAWSLELGYVGEPVPLMELLLAMGEKELVESSPFDQVWGIGLDAPTAKTTPREKWRGQNLLGKALMNVRNRIRREMSGTLEPERS